MAKQRDYADAGDGDGAESNLPDRVEDFPAWREPPSPPEIPDVLTRAVPKPESLREAERAARKGAGGGDTTMSDTSKAFGIALDFVATVFVGGFIGWGLAKWQGHMAGFVLGGLAIGMVAAFWRVVRRTQADERREAAAKAKRRGS